MAKIGKELLDHLISVDGPFVTIMLNTHVSHQDVEKDQLKVKNFAKEAKKRFEKKFPDHDWTIFQKKVDQLLKDASFWRNAATSVGIILTEKELFIHRLSIPVDDQYYVGDRPYLLAIIKNAQFNYCYNLLALNRDSMKLYHAENKKLTEIELPAGAPADIVTALGDELTEAGMNASGGADGGGIHGVNTKDEAVEIDWINYYQAVYNFLKDFLPAEKKIPLYLYALPENQTVFKKVAKNSSYDASVSVPSSPAQLSLKDIEAGTARIDEELKKKEIKEYNSLIKRKNIDQKVDIIQAAEQGKISHLFIATSNLIDGFGEDPDLEYDRRQVLNDIASNVIKNSGEVFILDQKDSPEEKKLLAILRY